MLQACGILAPTEPLCYQCLEKPPPTCYNFFKKALKARRRELYCSKLIYISSSWAFSKENYFC
ncbi:MAG: hypothetical protein DRH12_08105 [Deltaproteobacteria bacterium]|nr:MAG: hypothetical protein DRH12_08105 [Deltaproteobacteria bacterium]